MIYGAAGKRGLPAPVLDWKANAQQVYGEALRSLVASINGEATSHPDARFGAYVTAVIAAIERSIASHRPVELQQAVPASIDEGASQTRFRRR